MDVHEAEQDFANVAFELLDKTALVAILEKLNPIAVLALCQSNRQFVHICRDQTVFVKLMQLHYPGFPIALNAKSQYMAIAAGDGIKYSVPILRADYQPEGFQLLRGLYYEFGRVARMNQNGVYPQVERYFRRGMDTSLNFMIRRGETA